MIILVGSSNPCGHVESAPARIGVHAAGSFYKDHFCPTSNFAIHVSCSGAWTSWLTKCRSLLVQGLGHIWTGLSMNMFSIKTSWLPRLPSITLVQKGFKAVFVCQWQIYAFQLVTTDPFTKQFFWRKAEPYIYIFFPVVCHLQPEYVL